MCIKRIAIQTARKSQRSGHAETSSKHESKGIIRNNKSETFPRHSFVAETFIFYNCFQRATLFSSVYNLHTIGIKFTFYKTVIEPRYPTDPKCKLRIAFELNLHNGTRTAQSQFHMSNYELLRGQTIKKRKTQFRKYKLAKTAI